MKRRAFITLLGGAAAAWPIAASAQQTERMRRIGVLMSFAADSPEGRVRMAALIEGLRQLGWSDRRNIRIDIRWAAGNADNFRKYAAELIALEPDVVLATVTPAVTALQQASRTVPIVFVGVIDPVGSGLVASLARPGGNATGFLTFEYALAAKWLQLLKELAPRTTRAAVLRDPSVAAGIGQFAAIQAVGPIGLELSAIDLRDAGAIERAVAEFAREENGGLIVTSSFAQETDVIVALAARHKLPAVYSRDYFARAGGLLSYGSNLLDEYRRAGSYIDRILKGARPADLPLQAPTKYELVINLKTAKTLGLTVPLPLLGRADEVIE